jgi:hypothetical protein
MEVIMDFPLLPQRLLFTPEELNAPSLKKYDLLFSSINTSPLDESTYHRGRPPFSRPALLRALIYKNIRCLPSLTELFIELNENSTISITCGLDPSKPIPSVERFSSFLNDTPNSSLQNIRIDLVKQLALTEEITFKYLSADSCPIKANVKENNLKTSARDRFDKSKIPKGDPDCRLGTIVTFPSPTQRKIEYFWGYRNHVINDALSELPLHEITKPANVGESPLLIPNLKEIVSTYSLNIDNQIEAFIGDAAYDSIPNFDFIAKELKAKPIIAENPRNKNPQDLKLSRRGHPCCIAGFEMLSRGIFKDTQQNRTRHKFICPIRGSKKFAKQQPICPWWHPKFLSGKGCMTYLRVDADDSIRKNIDRHSPEFKKLYNLRTSSERIFSRLLSISMQYPTVKGLNATANLCTTAHITVLAVALTAVKIDQKDKIRYVKTLIPKLFL